MLCFFINNNMLLNFIVINTDLFTWWEGLFTNMNVAARQPYNRILVLRNNVCIALSEPESNIFWLWWWCKSSIIGCCPIRKLVIPRSVGNAASNQSMVCSVEWCWNFLMVHDCICLVMVGLNHHEIDDNQPSFHSGVKLWINLRLLCLEQKAWNASFDIH